MMTDLFRSLISKFQYQKVLIDLPNAPMTNKNNEKDFKMFILQASLFIASLSRNGLPFQVGMHSVGSGYSFYTVC